MQREGTACTCGGTRRLPVRGGGPWNTCSDSAVFVFQNVILSSAAETVSQQFLPRSIRHLHRWLISNHYCVSLGSGAQRALWHHQSVSFWFHHSRKFLWHPQPHEELCVWCCSPDLTLRGLLFGLSDGDATEAISSTCRSAVLHAGNSDRTPSRSCVLNFVLWDTVVLYMWCL